MLTNDSEIAFLAKERAEELAFHDDREDDRGARYCGGCGDFLYDFEHYHVTVVHGETKFTPSGFCCDCSDKKPVVALDSDIPF